MASKSVYFLFRVQEQARKALESALGEKKTEFEKWSKEIEKREEKGGGGASGRGGWFGGGGWFGWFGGENFWEEAQQAILTIVGIVSLVSKQMPFGALDVLFLFPFIHSNTYILFTVSPGSKR